MFKTVLIASTVLCTTASAWAYIPPSQFIVKSLAKKHNGYKSIVIRSSITGMENGQPNQVRFKELTFFNPRTSVMHSWAMNESGEILFSTERAGRNLPVATAVLFQNNPEKLIEDLKASGIPVALEPEKLTAEGEAELRANDKTTLHRWNHTAAWVLGETSKDKTAETKPSELHVPQLWIEKDTFLPLRLIAPAFEVQMENYRYYDEFPYPRAITLYEAGKKDPALKAESNDATIDYAADLPKEKGMGLTEAGKAAPNAVRELIQTYYQFVR